MFLIKFARKLFDFTLVDFFRNCVEVGGVHKKYSNFEGKGDFWIKLVK